MFTIWTLAKPESFVAVSDRFDIAKSTGHQIFTNIIYALAQLMPIYIQWPNAVQCHLSRNICFRIILFLYINEITIIYYYLLILDI